VVAVSFVRYRITARTDGGLDVAVDDDGTWRPPPADRGFRGRGIEMIRRLAAEAAIDVEDGTHVRFTMVPAVGPPVRSAATTARRPDAPAELDTSHDPDGRCGSASRATSTWRASPVCAPACSPRSTAPRRPPCWTCTA